MGREEAEAEAKRVRDEMTAMREDMDEAKERERRVAKRLDGVMVSFRVKVSNLLLSNANHTCPVRRNYTAQRKYKRMRRHCTRRRFARRERKLLNLLPLWLNYRRN